MYFDEAISDLVARLRTAVLILSAADLMRDPIQCFTPSDNILTYSPTNWAKFWLVRPF